MRPILLALTLALSACAGESQHVAGTTSTDLQSFMNDPNIDDQTKQNVLRAYYKLDSTKSQMLLGSSANPPPVSPALLFGSSAIVLLLDGPGLRWEWWLRHPLPSAVMPRKKFRGT